MSDSGRSDPERIAFHDGYIVIRDDDGKEVRAPVNDHTVAALLEASKQSFSGKHMDSVLLGGREAEPELAHGVSAKDHFTCSMCNRRFSRDQLGGHAESLNGTIDLCEGCHEKPPRYMSSVGGSYTRSE